MFAVVFVDAADEVLDGLEEHVDDEHFFVVVGFEQLLDWAEVLEKGWEAFLLQEAGNECGVEFE